MVAYYVPGVLDLLPAHGADAVRLQAKGTGKRRRCACRSIRWCRSRSASPCVLHALDDVNYVRLRGAEFGVAVLAGLVIMALGIPLYFFAEGR